MTAYEWARERQACEDALEWLQAHPEWTMADAWCECQRGDWMLWALQRVSHDRAAANRAVEVIVTRAVETHALHCGVPTVEQWAARWLSGEDRSEAAAAWAAASAREAAAARVAAVAVWEAWEVAGAAQDAARDAAWGVAAAAWAARAAAGTAVREAERARQADDIRREIPEWPGGDS